MDTDYILSLTPSMWLDYTSGVAKVPGTSDLSTWADRTGNVTWTSGSGAGEKPVVAADGIQVTADAQYAKTPFSAALMPSADGHTVIAIVKSACTANADGRGLIGKWGPAANGWAFLLRASSSGTKLQYAINSSGVKSCYGRMVPTAGFHSVVAVSGGTQPNAVEQIMTDGGGWSAAAATGVAPTTADDLYLFRYHPNISSAVGNATLQHLLVWNRKLTPLEIQGVLNQLAPAYVQPLTENRDGGKLYVDCTNGDDRNDGTTAASAVRTIEEAQRRLALIPGSVYTETPIGFGYGDPDWQRIVVLSAGTHTLPKVMAGLHDVSFIGTTTNQETATIDTVLNTNPNNGLFKFTVTGVTLANDQWAGELLYHAAQDHYLVVHRNVGNEIWCTCDYTFRDGIVPAFAAGQTVQRVRLDTKLQAGAGTAHCGWSNCWFMIFRFVEFNSPTGFMTYIRAVGSLLSLYHSRFVGMALVPHGEKTQYRACYLKMVGPTSVNQFVILGRSQSSVHLEDSVIDGRLLPSTAPTDVQAGSELTIVGVNGVRNTQGIRVTHATVLALGSDIVHFDECYYGFYLSRRSRGDYMPGIAGVVSSGYDIICGGGSQVSTNPTAGIGKASYGVCVQDTPLPTLPGAVGSDGSCVYDPIGAARAGLNDAVVVTGGPYLWKDATLLNGFANDPAYPNAGACRETTGVVRLRGAVNANDTTGATIFTLPEGSRPSKPQWYCVPNSNGTLSTVEIQADGDVVLLTARSGVVHLDGVSFNPVTV